MPPNQIECVIFIVFQYAQNDLLCTYVAMEIA
jgi:hypothetical protein